jgi:hypothetical protein
MNPVQTNPTRRKQPTAGEGLFAQPKNVQACFTREAAGVSDDRNRMQSLETWMNSSCHENNRRWGITKASSPWMSLLFDGSPLAANQTPTPTIQPQAMLLKLMKPDRICETVSFQILRLRFCGGTCFSRKESGIDCIAASCYHIRHVWLLRSVSLAVYLES